MCFREKAPWQSLQNPLQSKLGNSDWYFLQRVGRAQACGKIEVVPSYVGFLPSGSEQARDVGVIFTKWGRVGSGTEAVS